MIKGFIIQTILLIASLSSSQDAWSQSAEKHALLIGVADYPATGGWDPLSSMNDLAHMEKALLSQGFQKKNIQQLVNAQVSKTGIQQAFVGLINKVKKADIVVIHFSGHGLQLETNANKIDGLDECFVTFPALSPEKIDINDSLMLQKEMGQYLRGHELGELIKNLRKKLGPNGDVLVLLDFCNSGGATRGHSKVRGGKKPLVSKLFQANQHQRSDSSQLFREASLWANDPGLASYCVISATRPEELDVETKDENGKGIGPLSYAAARSFQKLNANTSYQSLFAKIQSNMYQLVKEQHPILEGNANNKQLFGGALIQQEPFFEIDQIQSPLEMTIKAGNLMGLGEGTTLGFYPIGTNNPKLAKPMAMGTIIKSNRYDAVVQLSSNSHIKSPNDAWVFVQEKSMALPKLTLGIDQGRSIPWTAREKANLDQLIQSNPNLSISSEPDLWLVKGVEKDSILVTANGYCFVQANGLLASAEQLKESIRRYGQYQFLLGLNDQDANHDLLVQLLPVVNGQIDSMALVSKTNNGILSFTEGDYISLSIQNKGKKPVYVNILDLQPDGIINAILPFKNAPEGKRNYYAQDLRIMPGQTYVFDPKDFVIKLSKPFGTEWFKVFVSEKEIDLEPMATNKYLSGNNIQKRGNLTQLESLLMDSYQPMLKRGSTNIDGSVFDLIFNIKPKTTE